jgi:AraC-like DNA-binding protein
MSDSAAALETPSTGNSLPPQLVQGIAGQPLFANDDLRISRWRCVERATGLTSSRAVEYHVISFVHSGSFRLHAQARTTFIDANRVVILPPHLPYQTSHPCGCGDAGSSLALSPGVWRDLWRGHDQRRAELRLPVAYACGPCPSPTLLRQRALVRALDSASSLCGLAAEESALRIADEVIGACANLWRRKARPLRVEARRRREAVDAAQVFLWRNLGRRLQLKDIAAAAEISTSSLRRFFVAELGEPVHRYLIRLRLRAALERLQDRRCDITDLAFELGFASSSHLAMAFRQEFSLTPSGWRDRTRTVASRLVRPG